ncbi:chemotaxis protein CheA [Azohydromonas aeria]|uniref:chemotaxis protein CheA n=1 Tax=Azohydromonas aeria TaxID=2590212 RepID=UPI0012FB34A2|nr:chemotaxis protein CheA [Azohydromonas aeria]
MNTAELLEQFVVEARECLETIGQRLLEVERNPRDAALLGDLFRNVHTLKGNCGLFEFKPLERVVHAAEDLLDRVRDGRMAWSAELSDALLDAMDHVVLLIDQIEQSGAITDAGRSQALADALRALLAAEAPAQAGAAVAAAPEAPGTDTSAPDWLDRLDAAARAAHPQAVALYYRPETDCFFKGEDPWRLAATAPGLLHVQALPQSPWPEGEALVAWDCYQCNLEFVLLSGAPAAELLEHFRCVAEQVQWHQAPAEAQAAVEVTAAAPAPQEAPASEAAVPVLRAQAEALWRRQVQLLDHPGVEGGLVEAVRRALRGLSQVLELSDAVAALDALPSPAPAAAVLALARTHAVAAAAPAAEAAAVEAAQAAEAVPVAGAAAVPAAAGADHAGGQRVLKVAQEKVDRLMDLIGEMVVAKNALPYLAQRAENQFGQRELAREIKAQYAVINRIADEMQSAIMQVRMLPVGVVFQRFHRLVRDISRKLGKDVRLELQGEDTEADKNVIESLADPLIHILRNSLDHGIEAPAARVAAGKPAQGVIRVRAAQQGDRVEIEIEDDGAGVNAARVRAKAVERGLIPAERAASLSDAEAVQLVFLPGFSTAEVISDLSGRGVGMDVVRTAVERVGGRVELRSRAGQGTAMRLSLPLSMAVSHVMLVECAGRRFGVPMEQIVETVRVPGEDIHQFKQARTAVLRGRIVPLRPLGELLALDAPPLANADGELAVLVLRLGAQHVGLLVDQFHGASDIILKPLEGVLAGLTGFAGTALMGDGSVLMVLNPKELL